MEVKKTNAGHTTVVHWRLPTYEDNSGEHVSLFTESVPGSGFTLGRHQINYVGTDRSGNKASCTFTITVSGGLILFIFGCVKATSEFYLQST